MPADPDRQTWTSGWRGDRGPVLSLSPCSWRLSPSCGEGAFAFNGSQPSPSAGPGAS